MQQNNLNRIARSFAVSICLFAARAAFAEVPAHPTMIILPTGSRLATWNLPATGVARRTPVVFLHGGPGGFVTTGAIDKGASLRAAGFTTFYFDQAGTGQSDRIPAVQYTLDRAVADVEALRKFLNADRIVLWGSSYGADLAVLYEQRFPDKVAGLIFTSPASFPGTKPDRDYRVTNDPKTEASDALSRAARMIDRQGAAAEATLSQDAAGKLFDADLNNGALDGRMVCKGSTAAPPTAVTGGNLYPNRMLAKELKGLKPLIAVLATTRRPAITIRGACDFIPLSSAEKYKAAYGGTLVTIPATGHGLRENPSAFDSTLRQFALGPLAVLE